MKPNKPNNKPAPTRRDTVLLILTGMSPAVITETVWALCHEPDFLGPLHVRPITTTLGASAIEQALHHPDPAHGGDTVWQALRAALQSSTRLDPAALILDDPRVLQRLDPKTGRMAPLDDIRTAADNEAVAEFLLDEVRRVTENPDTTLIASLAGGRKTMGAMLQVTLGLLAREQDRLTHVLVTEPYESPHLRPRFHFPAKGQIHTLTTPGGKTSQHPAHKARIQLADVPILRLRQLFPQHYGQLPGHFSQLIEASSAHITKAAGPPTVQFLQDGQRVSVNATLVKLSTIECALYRFMADRCRDRKTPIDRQADAADRFKEWLTAWGKTHSLMSAQRETAEEWAKNLTEDDLRKKLSSLRAKFKKAGLARLEPYLLPAKREPLAINIHMKEQAVKMKAEG